MPLIPWKPYLTNCSLFHSIEFNLKLVLVDSTFAWLFLFELMEINLLLWCVMERWLIECTLMCPMEWSPVGLCFIELISMHSPLACFKFRVSYLMYRLAFKCTFVEFSTNWYWISFQIHSFSDRVYFERLFDLSQGFQFSIVSSWTINVYCGSINQPIITYIFNRLMAWFNVVVTINHDVWIFRQILNRNIYPCSIKDIGRSVGFFPSQQSVMHKENYWKLLK